MSIGSPTTLSLSTLALALARIFLSLSSWRCSGRQTFLQGFAILSSYLLLNRIRFQYKLTLPTLGSIGVSLFFSVAPRFAKCWPVDHFDRTQHGRERAVDVAGWKAAGHRQEFSTDWWRLWLKPHWSLQSCELGSQWSMRLYLHIRSEIMPRDLRGFPAEYSAKILQGEFVAFTLCKILP